MKVKVRYTIINAVVVIIAITSSTILFLSQLRSQAVADAKHEQVERLRAFRVLLEAKGAPFEIRDGKLWAGNCQLSGNNALPDQIRDIFGGTATIFQGDVRVATNVLTPEGNRALGTRLTGPPRDAIFKEGREYHGEIELLGEHYISAYEPIRDGRGRVIGALYVGVQKEQFFGLYDDMKGKVISGCVLLTFVFLGFSFLTLRFRRNSVRALEARERKMKAILNNIPDLAWIKDREGRFIAVNTTFAQSCSRSPDDLVGRTDLDIWPTELAEAYRADDREVMATGQGRRFEERLVNSRGETVWLETLKTPIFNSQGEIVGTTGIARDVTARRQVEEELRFTRYSVEHSRDGISWLGEDGRFVFANESLCSIFSIAPEELDSLAIFDLVPQYTPEHWAERWRALERQGSQTLEIQALARDGRLVPVEVSSNFLLFNGKGRVCSFVRDISERKRFEQNNQHTLSILSATLESIADGILVLDLDKRVVMYNRKYTQMLGIPEPVMAEGYQAMLNHIIPELREPDLFRDRLAVMMARPEQEHALLMEFLDGRTIERISCPHLVGDQVAGIVLNFRDITMQRRVENHLRNAQKVEALGTLTGGIAHDFNNRLTAIIGYGTLIKSQPANWDQNKRYLDLLLTSADRAAELTKGLLAYSRKQTLNPVLLGVNQLVNEVEKFLPPILGENIRLCIELSKETPMVQADRGQLEQVLFNLVGNARDAMQGEGRLTIATGAAYLDQQFVAAQGYGKSGDYAILSVTDTGSGMEAAVQEKIFEPFFTTKEVGKGTGLGLSIVYGIVKQHNGFINVVSEPGNGTTFWIYLPRERGQAHEPSVSKLEPSLGKGETVLLVEDDKEVRALFREVLSCHGYSVIEAVDGAEGVLKFREFGPAIDLLVIDVIMPRKNGWEAFGEIRKLRSDVKALFLSGYTNDVINRAGFADQSLYFLPKPVSPALLLAKLRELLE